MRGDSEFSEAVADGAGSEAPHAEAGGRTHPLFVGVYWAAMVVIALAVVTVVHEAGHFLPGALFRVTAAEPLAPWPAFPVWQQVVTAGCGILATFATVGACRVLLVSRLRRPSAARNLVIATGAFALARAVPVLLVVALPYALGAFERVSFDEHDLFRGARGPMFALLLVEIVLFARAAVWFTEWIPDADRRHARMGLALGGAVALLVVTYVNPSV